MRKLFVFSSCIGTMNLTVKMMGLLDFLFGNKRDTTVQVLNDRIWLPQNAKINGIKQQIRPQTDSAAILLVAHFKETLQQLRAIAAGDNSGTPVQLVLAENLTSDITSRLNTDETSTIDLIVAERHPLKSADDALMLFAQDLSCRCRVAYHLSLEDPVVKLFVGEFVEKMLESLGMKEDEPIESQMVSRRIRAAQQKNEERAFGNSRAFSAAEWLESNMPKS